MLKVASALAAVGSLRYQGTWNASANSPFLQSGVGVTGYYYVVNVAGSTNLDGITDWKIGDWAVFNGTVWEKIDNTDVVTSVNGQVGAVVLTAANVGAVSNTVNILTGTGLTGGGQLTANVSIAMANTAVAAGTYGNQSTVGTFTVDAQGRLTAASNATIQITAGQVSGIVPNTTFVLAGTGLSGGGALTGNVTLNLANTTVAAGVYGNASTVGSFTVDAQGRLTAASNTTISIAPSQINATIPNSGLANSTLTLGNTTLTLGSTTSTVGNLTINNVTIGSGSVSGSVTTASLNLTGTTNVNATFATSSLPLVPEGYIVVQIGGVNKKIPYYAV
jgi:hypothetical protein